jgi:hypothetical protein
MQQAHERAQGGGLARTVGPEQAEDLPPFHPQRQVIHRQLAIPEPLGQASDLQRHIGEFRHEAAPAAGPAGHQDQRGGHQRGRGRCPHPPRHPAGDHGQRRVPGHGHAPPGQCQLVDGRPGRAGVGEVGGGQHEPEPVAGREVVVEPGQRHTDHPATLCAGDPHRRHQLAGQGGVARLVDVVDLGEQRHHRRPGDPEPDRGGAG